MPPLGVLGALQFLTRIPIRLRAAPDIARCVPWFPVVGAAIGAVVNAGDIDQIACADDAE